MSQPCLQLKTLRDELEQYDSSLLERPSGILANKTDVNPSTETLTELKNYAENLNLPVFPISAEKKIGIIPVMHYVRKLYDLSNMEEETGKCE